MEFRITFSRRRTLRSRSRISLLVCRRRCFRIWNSITAVLTEYTYPRKLTDLFRGMQLTIIGRYKNTNDLKDITLRLTGMAGKERRTFTYQDLDFPNRNEENGFLPRLWASRRVGWLLEQVRSNGETKRYATRSSISARATD